MFNLIVGFIETLDGKGVTNTLFLFLLTTFALLKRCLFLFTLFALKVGLLFGEMYGKIRKIDY